MSEREGSSVPYSNGLDDQSNEGQSLPPQSKKNDSNVDGFAKLLAEYVFPQHDLHPKFRLSGLGGCRVLSLEDKDLWFMSSLDDNISDGLLTATQPSKREIDELLPDTDAEVLHPYKRRRTQSDEPMFAYEADWSVDQDCTSSSDDTLVSDDSASSGFGDDVDSNCESSSLDVSQPSATSTNSAEAFKAEWLEWLDVAQEWKPNFRLNEAQLNLALSLVPKKGKWAQAKWWFDQPEFVKFYRVSNDRTSVEFDVDVVYPLLTLVCYFDELRNDPRDDKLAVFKTFHRKAGSTANRSTTDIGVRGRRWMHKKLVRK
mmetsp:Transcript_12735/g.21634  ORF Transcript_12735/g.21634 Transcript_12735/m.21634 type:complete len:315 (+) Transcript_12735:46-990(+)